MFISCSPAEKKRALFSEFRTIIPLENHCFGDRPFLPFEVGRTRAIALINCGQREQTALQLRFEHTDWSVFATQATLDSHTDIDSYASSVLDFINTNIDSVTTLKRITTFPNQKPWINKEVRLLLKARDTAFRSGDTQAYSSS